MRTALLDGDLLFYAIAAAAEYGIDPDDVNLEEVFHSMEVRACNVMVDAGCDKKRIFLTKNNFRHFVASDYKAHRKDTWRPSILPLVRDYAEIYMGAEIVDGLEADDLLAIYQDENTVICTIDKDLQQVNGNHYRWAYNNKESESFVVTDGWRMFYKQLLTGDSTDNIIGCGIRVKQIYKSGAKVGQEYEKRKGVGEKTAIKLLENCRTAEEAEKVVLREYMKVFGEHKALQKMTQQARLIYMVREIDGNYAKMWMPIGMDDVWMDVKTGEFRLDG